jgi:hypothetical protein
MIKKNEKDPGVEGESAMRDSGGECVYKENVYHVLPPFSSIGVFPTFLVDVFWTVVCNNC